jgi:hypothetical protein
MFFSKKKTVTISIDLNKILLGGENDLSGYRYSLLTGDFKRPSCRAASGPHATLLRDYLEFGDRVLEAPLFEQTAYFKNAQQCIDLFGDYFPGIDVDERIVLAAERFVRLFDGREVVDFPAEGHSRDGDIIQVVPIRDSDCYQLIQGNHRVAFAVAQGKTHIKARVDLRQTEVTPIQFLLENLQWEKGEKVVYQPLPCPELELNWTLGRRCSDRLARMISFISRPGRPTWDNMRLLDLGSYYGWFVSEFARRGLDAEGVEKDNIAIQIGKIAYGNLDERIHRTEMRRFLGQLAHPYDVVCCLSIMHHLITGRERGNALELLRLVDRATKDVLFFEMGQEDERWFASALNGWNVDAIEKWVLDNTNFASSFRLGPDEDGVGRFAGNFGRTLFAFIK